MGAMRPWHLVVLLIVILLLFGAKRLPDLAKSVGQSMKIFKKEIKELADDDVPAHPVAPSTTATPATPASGSTASESTAPPKA